MDILKWYYILNKCDGIYIYIYIFLLYLVNNKKSKWEAKLCFYLEFPWLIEIRWSVQDLEKIDFPWFLTLNYPTHTVPKTKSNE